MTIVHAPTNRLIDALARSLPRFDPAPLLVHPPEAEDGIEEIGAWLHEQLEAQSLADTLEWMRFCGDIPNLKSLADVDFSAFDAFWDTAQETAAGKVAMPWDWKFLEVMNGILQAHGLAIAELVEPGACDSTTLLCVTTDAAALEDLETALADLGLGLRQYEPMTGAAALAALDARGETEVLASRLVHHLAKPQTKPDGGELEDKMDRFFGGLTESLSARLLADRLAEIPGMQGENAGFTADFLFVALTSKPIGWVFRGIRAATRGLLALLVLGSVAWLGLRLGGYAELAGDVFRFTAWGAGLLLLWCATALCALFVAARRHRRFARKADDGQ